MLCFGTNRSMANCSRIPPTHFNPRFPCGERQPPAPETAMPVNYFNPRPPCGGRQDVPLEVIERWLFQSTPPRKGRRHELFGPAPAGGISIHVPHAGATGKAHKFGWHFCSKQRRFPGSILLQGYYTGYFFRKQLCCGGILGAKGAGGGSGHQRRSPVYFLAASRVMLTLSLL